MTEFGGALRWSWVMGGLARDYTEGYVDAAAGIHGGKEVYARLATQWMDVAETTGMPLDPRLWSEAPIGSTYPGCMAVKAAAEQPHDGSALPEAAPAYRCLRALREGLLCFRRKLDTTDALAEAARGAGLDARRFRSSLDSHAIVEAFGSDLEEARQASEPGHVRQATVGEKVTLPSASFLGDDGVRHTVYGCRRYEDYRDAALAAGARPSGDPAPGPLDALGRFGRMATREVDVVCGLPGPRAAAELWRLAVEWRVKPVRILTGYLWEPA
jgi:hypothetical protein